VPARSGVLRARFGHNRSCTMQRRNVRIWSGAAEKQCVQAALVPLRNNYDVAENVALTLARRTSTDRCEQLWTRLYRGFESLPLHRRPQTSITAPFRSFARAVGVQNRWEIALFAPREPIPVIHSDLPTEAEMGGEGEGGLRSSEVAMSAASVGLGIDRQDHDLCGNPQTPRSRSVQ